MKVALVFNPFAYKLHEENLRIVQRYFGLFPPLSLTWVAALAERAGHEVIIIDARTLQLTPDQVLRYRRKISGPLLDRIDIQMEVPTVPSEELARAQGGETSSAIRTRVMSARERMRLRQGKENAQLRTAEIDAHCAPDAAGSALLNQAIGRLGLSARGYHRILKLARTIADLAHADRPAGHVHPGGDRRPADIPGGRRNGIARCSVLKKHVHPANDR